jgi:hypothetical protein
VKSLRWKDEGAAWLKGIGAGQAHFELSPLDFLLKRPMIPQIARLIFADSALEFL